jgi:hypothetical protein
VYKGVFCDGKMHGKGIFTYSTGGVHHVDFRYGKMLGKGTYTNANGKSLYDGRLVNSKKHGKGTHTNAKDKVYNGDWVDDKKHDEGNGTTAIPITEQRLRRQLFQLGVLANVRVIYKCIPPYFLSIFNPQEIMLTWCTWKKRAC